MGRKAWSKPRLIVLVRTLPEDGVLQVQVCKFAGVDGPAASDCINPQPGIEENCFDQVIR
jgi:hypothetical protein